MTEAKRLRVPDPLVLLSACILLAAVASWLLPAGEFGRREDPATGLFSDYLVMPGFYVIENDSDGVVWALSPHHVRAWFEPISA